MQRKLVIGFGLLFGLGLVGFTSPTPDLNPYSRTPLNVKLQRLEKAGEDFFMRRRYEDAIGVFDAMDLLDKGNLTALLWRKKCDEKLFQEKSEKFKANLLRNKGSLLLKERLYDNWTWGPMVGHFEIRESKPKPYVPPVKKIRPPISDAELKKLKDAGTDAAGLFDLALGLNSRKDTEKAFDALDEAALRDPEIMGRDDEGLVAGLQERFSLAFSTGKITPKERLLAARVAMFSGDLSDAVLQFIKAASREDALKAEAQKGVERILSMGKIEFLQKPPEIFRFAQVYSWQGNEDRVYVAARINPTTPHYVFPFDFPFDPKSIETVEIQGGDFLFGTIDPSATESTRIWFSGKDIGDEPRNLELQAVIRFKPGLIDLDLTTWSVPAELANNWSVIVGPTTAFTPDFPAPQKQKGDGGVDIKGFQVQQSGGKGPYLQVDVFHKTLPHEVDVFKALADIWEGS